MSIGQNTQAGDPVAAALDKIRERAKDAADLPLAEIAEFNAATNARALSGWIAASALDVPHLLAVVDALLGLANDWTRQSADLDEMAERAEGRGADPLRTTLMSARAQARQDSAGELRATISRVLAREVT